VSDRFWRRFRWALLAWLGCIGLSTGLGIWSHWSAGLFAVEQSIWDSWVPVMLGVLAGHYGSVGVQGLVTVRRMPRVIHLELGGDEYVGILKRGRALVYAWAMVTFAVAVVARGVWQIVSAF
jgi:hypothetical protein